MDLSIKNFGKIAEADIKLDGITVICGNNDTGKSTVGKALFAFFNVLCNYKTKIEEQKCNALINFIFKNEDAVEFFKTDKIKNLPRTIITEHNGKYTYEEIKEYLDKHCPLKVTKEKIMSLVDKLNTSDEDILNLSIFRYFTNIMNGQFKNIKAINGKCIVEGKFKDKKNIIKLLKNKCECELGVPIIHQAYYINNPFVIDFLNTTSNIQNINFMERPIIKAITEAQEDINNNPMTNILEFVVNSKELDDIREVLKKVYSGDTKFSDGRYFYSENGTDIDIRNISSGLKAFAIIERMLECGVLKKKDVLILDEPEMHLHSEWQLVYAELIVLIQSKFDLMILITTHSTHFLEALVFFMEKYGISEKGNYYIPKTTEKGSVITYDKDNLSVIKKNMRSGAFKLADMRLDYLDSEDHDDNFNLQYI